MQWILRSSLRAPCTTASRGPVLRHSSLFHTTPRTPFRLTRTLKQEVRSEAPSFRSKVVSEVPQEAFTDKVGRPGAGKQILFVAFGTFFAFSYAASRTNIETDYWKKKMPTINNSWNLSLPASITTLDLKRVQQAEFVKKLRDWFTTVNARMQDVPAIIRPWVAGGLVAVLQPWVDASEGKRLCWKICMLNAAVWAAWKIPKWQSAMNVRFMHNPLSGLAYTLLTSMFSHRSFLHLAMNCLALEGFGSAAYYFLVKEQARQEPFMLESTASFHFLAFFLSAGLFSGLVSHVVSTKFRYPRLITELATHTHSAKKVETWAGAVSAATTKAAAAAAPELAKKTVPSILPSLGASGAIYATVTMTALAFPESQIALIIPPSYPINIQWGVGGLMMLDLVGIMRGWRMFDHWAHLGGAAFGIAYYAYGSPVWHKFRQALEIQMPQESNGRRN